jgi:hypothetical protein
MSCIPFHDCTVGKVFDEVPICSPSFDPLILWISIYFARGEGRIGAEVPVVSLVWLVSIRLGRGSGSVVL